MADISTLTTRLEYLEATVNRILVSLQKYLTIDQGKQLVVIRQTEIEDLQGRVTALENQVEALEALNKI